MLKSVATMLPCYQNGVEGATACKGSSWIHSIQCHINNTGYVIIVDSPDEEEHGTTHTGLIKASWSKHPQKSLLISNMLQELKDNVNSNNKLKAFVQALIKPATAYSNQSPIT